MSYFALGSTGPQVGQVQQRLIELGFHIDASDLSATKFGISTQVAVRDFQRDQRLHVDGVVGADTLTHLEHPTSAQFAPPGWRCFPSDAPECVRRVLEVAVGDLGLRERPDGSNDGPELAKFDTRGLAWCAQALSVWYHYADEGCPWGSTRSVWNIYEWAQGAGKILPKQSIPMPGDVGVILRPDGHGHTFLIVHVFPGANRLCTLGGNEGNAVRGAIRSRDSITAIIRPHSCG
jgi:hypothetical protein